MRIAIASGKGGTGKTLIASNFANSLSAVQPTQIIDCDVEEPNVKLFFSTPLKKIKDVETIAPIIDQEKCIGCGVCAKRCMFNALSVIKSKIMFFPELCHSCGGCILFCLEDAIKKGNKKIGEIATATDSNLEIIEGKLEVGATLAPEVIDEAVSLANNNSICILDAPPGTSCTAVATIKSTDYCVLVTEPTPYGLHDLKLAVEVTKQLKVPFGVIINKLDHIVNETSNFCHDNGIPILMTIPFDKEIAEAYADGKLFSKGTEYQKKFIELLERIERKISNA